MQLGFHNTYPLDSDLALSNVCSTGACLFASTLEIHARVKSKEFPAWRHGTRVHTKWIHSKTPQGMQNKGRFYYLAI